MKQVQRYVALDFETMNHWRASVCAVGCVVIEKGVITEEFYSQICPPTPYENPYCVETHGLTYNDVKDSPKFSEIWPVIDKMIGSSPIVAHNSPFEKSCIDACGEEFGTKTDYEYIDTLKMSRMQFPNARNHRLNTLCEAMDIKLEHYHNALDDARADAECFLKLKSLGNYCFEMSEDGTLLTTNFLYQNVENDKEKKKIEEKLERNLL